jgi:hypothetical protein
MVIATAYPYPFQSARAGLLTDALPRTVSAAVFFSCYLSWRPSQDIMFTLSDALFLMGLFTLTLRGRIPLEPMRFFTPYWLLGFGLVVIGLLVGSISCPTPMRWLFVAGQYLFAWVVLAMILMRRGEVTTVKLLKTYVWGVFAMNLFGAFIFFRFHGSFYEAHDLLGKDFLSGARRLGAFTGDANWNGAVLAMTAPMVFFLHSKREIGNLLTFVWLAVVLLGVILTASFTAFIGCAASIAIFVMAGGIRIRPRTFLPIVTVLTLAGIVYFGNGGTLPQVFVSRVGNAIDSGDISQAGTFVGRMALIREAWGIAQEHLLVGLGADQYRIVSMYQAPVHNMYLLLWSEGGLVSMLGWVLMQAVMLAVAVKAYARDHVAAALTLSVTTMFLIMSTASPHMYARLWSVPILLALAVSIEVVQDSRPLMRRRAVLRRVQVEA